VSAGRAEVGGEIEAAQHARKPLRQIIRYAREQEIRRDKRGGAAPAGAQQAAIEDHGPGHRLFAAFTLPGAVECARTNR
jgi:hypothetical protein